MIANCGERTTDMTLLHIVWYVIVGFVAGLIARAILPGADHMGFVWTTVVGLLGAVVGGLIGRAFSKPEPGAKSRPGRRIV